MKSAIKTSSFCLLFILIGCVSNKHLVYYYGENEPPNEVGKAGESYFFNDSTMALFSMQRGADNTVNVAIHYPYFFTITNDTITYYVFHHEKWNDNTLVRTDSLFELGKSRIDGKKLYQVSYKSHTLENDIISVRQRDKSKLQDLLHELARTDSINWFYYCYDCDTLGLAEPIEFSIDDIGDKEKLRNISPLP